MRHFKLLYLLLAIVAGTTAAWADDSGQCGDNLYWSYVESTHTLTISGSGAMNNYATYTSKPWHAWRKDITSVVLPEGLTGIGDCAFYGCTALTSITIHDGVTTIGKNAFNNCSNLSSITIPTSVTSIGVAAFATCKVLTSIEIPSGVTAIADNTFNSCLNLNSIDIPSSVTSIGVAVFMNCQALESITIPANVTEIGSMAFKDCSNLADIYVGWTSTPPIPGDDALTGIASGATFHVPYGTSTNYTSAPWNSFTIVEMNPSGQCGDDLTWEYDPSTTTLTITGSGAMTDYNNSDDVPWADFTVDITSVVLPEGLTTIGKDAFVFCTSLTSITIPAGVTSIGEEAFYDCSNMASVTFAEGSQLTSIGDYAFDECASLTSITIPAGVTSIGNGVFNKCTGLTSITIPAGVTSIGYGVFGECYGLTTITIPNSVTSIGDEAFYYCTSLTDVYVNWTNPNSVDLGAAAFFYYGVELENINLHVPHGTKATYQATNVWKDFNIVEEAFPNGTCGDNLTWEYNPTTHVLTITGTGTMNNYYGVNVPWVDFRENITSVVLPEGMTTIGKNAFFSCSNLTSITIPASVTGIGQSAFYDCTSLASVTFAEGSQLTGIGDYAFQLCAALTSFTIPAGVTSIGDQTFWGCTSLTSVTIPSTVTSIGAGAFGDCTGLTSVTIPAGVTSIVYDTFGRCSGLTSVTIPASVTSIDDEAFADCTSLTDMYVNWTNLSGVTLSSYAFQGVTLANVNLHFPFEAWSNYETANVWKNFKQMPVISAKEDPDHAGVYYNTFYHSSVAYALPAGVEAYTAQRSGSDLILTKIAQAGDVLPANTAVILKSSVASYEMTPSDASPVTVGGNDLQGVDAATSAPSDCYVLSGKSSDNSVTGVGFYQFSGTLAAHKAYVVFGGSSAPQRMRFIFAEEQTATGVENASVDNDESQKRMENGRLVIIKNGVRYNAQGQIVK